MGCRGVHFALDDGTVKTLRSFKSDAARLEYVAEGIEDEYFAKFEDLLLETDKAWDAIHRALTDGKLAQDNGTYPLNHVILGGELLYHRDDYIMSLKSPVQVRDVASAVATIDTESFRQRYFKIDPRAYGCPVDEDDFEYTWSWFEPLRDFFTRAAQASRHVLFTADQ